MMLPPEVMVGMSMAVWEEAADAVSRTSELA